MAIRLRDVAEYAGVSVKTVSNVVNKRPVVRPEMQARVEAAIRELGYRPNATARSLRYGRSGFVALVVPQLDSPYFAALADRFTAAAQERGWVTLLEATNSSSEAELAVVSGQQSHLVDGIVFSPVTLGQEAFVTRTDTTPMVLLGERGIPDGFPSVSMDSVAAARAMTEHLISLGRTRIAAIGRESETGTASVRLAGYRQALKAAGLPAPKQYAVGVPEYSRAAGKAAMDRLLDLPEPPDAVFCFNDLMAIGAMRACTERGVAMPEEIAVAGVDDIAEGRFSSPTLTTVRPDMDALVSSTLDCLLGQIDGEDCPPPPSVPWELVLRESTVGRAG